MLLVQMQPPAAMEEEFHAWYDTEHVPERETVPGFLSAARFVCVEGWPRYMACYDLSSLDVLEADAYLRIGGDNLSVWSKRVLGHVVGYERLELSQSHPAGADPVAPSGGKVMLRFGSCERDMVLRGVEALAAACPAASLRLFDNALPAGQTTAMLDAPALDLVPAWTATELSDALGEVAASLLGVWRYRRYVRWT
jgi:hypothetical protein